MFCVFELCGFNENDFSEPDATAKLHGRLVEKTNEAIRINISISRSSMASWQESPGLRVGEPLAMRHEPSIVD